MSTTTSLAGLPERQLFQRFAALVHQDRANTAQLLEHIAEIDARKLWAKHACSSMFAFCMERFRMSESMTAKRIWAARTARRFPVILPMVASGELHLSGINQLGKHLTDDNHRELLARARHKSSREIDVLVAELAPRPDVPSRVRALPRSMSRALREATAPTSAKEQCSPRPSSRNGDTCTHASDGPRDAFSLGAHASEADARTAVHASDSSNAGFRACKSTATHEQLVPLAPQRFKIEITIDQNTHDRLRALQDLLKHQCPNVDPALIVSRAIELLFDETLKKKAAITERLRSNSAPSTKRTRAIPAAIRREVWKRDLGRCTFTDDRGRRCRATSCIEYHHEIPYGKGGHHEVENIALRCRAHNQYQADLDFGREFMLRKRHTADPVL